MVCCGKVDKRMKELLVTDLQEQGAVTGQWKKKGPDKVVDPYKEGWIWIPSSLHSKNQFSVVYRSKYEN